MTARIALGIVSVLLATAVQAGPVRVRLTEGNARGFLVLRSLQGDVIGGGELSQKPAGPLVESRLTARFKDGSLREETTTFSQNEVFRLESYRLVQRGPSFPTMEVSFDRTSGRYQAVVQEKKGGKEETASGTFDVPADVYNGMAVVLLRNLPAGTSSTAQMAVFLPKPRLLRMTLGAEGEDRVIAGGEALKAVRYLVKLEVGGMAGAIASLIGMIPPDLRYWLVLGDAPGFVRFEGAMFVNGPVWRLEMAPVEWPK
jgi:hypothetical protein